MQNAIQIIQKQIDNGTLHSAVMHVRYGKDTFQQAFGRAKDADAIFLLASITKTMTAAGVMVLADRGELRLSDKAMKFIPEFSEGARKDITIEQLLTHTSGLPDQLENNTELRSQHAPLSEFVRGAIRTPLLFAPGTKYHYQSMGILLAAEIVERIAKTKLPDFLTKEVFAPLGMSRTALGLGSFKFEDTIRCQTEHAAPESGAGDSKAASWDWNSAYWRNLAAPWGGAHGSAADVARFLDSFIHPTGKVLREETARLMIQNHTSGLESRRGVGFALGPEGFGKGCSQKSFGHSGSTGTLAWADPETDTTCVILTSLPSRVSGDTILHPVADVVSAS
ncbi:serine hydrolase domain-containing protein [Prosthecobacter sp.]|uniref:serine hydrolase domain-containing protein n=1 Tax=Prosthecobacter sp. TaxID=1965333 RepID=UPI002ABB46F4|nr:serine hydrolase domain-containing protein [Prosthecobacter sp.]MDZ4405124.1 serine hydrolase domain-containing protein [Prosthecobacter sp.]